MLRYLRLLILPPALLALSSCATVERPLKFDPQVRRGQLENGLTYYVRQNSKPSNRVELRLVIKAGSVLEEDDQQGLAHFVEHMAFNGTEHFEKHELVDYLESIGMSFGADLNAYTGFDETVYMLQLPTDDPESIDKGFRILSDWACCLALDGEEIDKERGVVVEEWRLRRGAGQRVRDKQFPVLFHGSRYAERLPIGKKDVLDTFDHERLRNFYQTWYRPDLMSVVAVGDMPAGDLEQKVREVFGALKNRPGAPSRSDFAVPGHDEMLVSAVTDPEASSSSVSLYHKRPVDPLLVEGDYRRTLVESLFNNMFNQRLDELRQQENPPFLSAYSYKGGFIRAIDMYVLGAEVKDAGAVAGLEALLTEAERVRRFGFTETEFLRTKVELKRWKQKSYAERHNTESRVYAGAYVHSFTRDQVALGVEEAMKQFQYLHTKNLLFHKNDK